MLDDRVHLAVLQLRVVLDPVLGALHDRGDDARLLALAHDVVSPPRPRPPADDRVELVLVGHARLVGRETRVERAAPAGP